MSLLSKSSSGSKASALTLYLKHFRNSTIDYVLEKTGYSCITEYEDLCYYTDLFPIQVSVNGAIQVSVPTVDPRLYRVFKLSVHHLNERVRKHIMSKYVGMSTLDYELLHADKNTIVIWVPYKDESVRRSSSSMMVAGVAPGADEETEEDISDEEVWVPCTPPVVLKAKPQPQPEKRSTRAQCVEDDDDKPLVPLFGWKFKMNSATNNSYILTPPTSVQWVKSGTVGWGDSKTPTSWHAPVEGLARPIYYNNATGGWIVSLSLREQLAQAGARELK